MIEAIIFFIIGSGVSISITMLWLIFDMNFNAWGTKIRAMRYKWKKNTFLSLDNLINDILCGKIRKIYKFLLKIRLYFLKKLISCDKAERQELIEIIRLKRRFDV